MSNGTGNGQDNYPVDVKYKLALEKQQAKRKSEENKKDFIKSVISQENDNVITLFK